GARSSWSLPAVVCASGGSWRRPRRNFHLGRDRVPAFAQHVHQLRALGEHRVVAVQVRQREALHEVAVEEVEIGGELAARLQVERGAQLVLDDADRLADRAALFGDVVTGDGAARGRDLARQGRVEQGDQL